EPVLPDQVEQEIERPLERRKPQPEIRRRRRQLRGRLDLARLGPRHDPYPAIARVMASIQSWMTTTGQRIRLPPKQTTARRRKGAEGTACSEARAGRGVSGAGRALGPWSGGAGRGWG